MPVGKKPSADQWIGSKKTDKTKDDKGFCPFT